MGVYDAVRTVLAVRSYTHSPIPEESQRRILEASRLSASARNRQPWHFVVVDDIVVIGKIAELAKSGPYIAGAQLVIAVAIEKTSQWAVSDASRAIQSMVLTAWDEGIGSNWVGFGGMTDIAALLAVPDNFDLFAVLPFGYPVDSVGKGEKKRKSLTEIASRGSFGNPFT